MKKILCIKRHKNQGKKQSRNEKTLVMNNAAKKMSASNLHKESLGINKQKASNKFEKGGKLQHLCRGSSHSQDACAGAGPPPAVVRET